MLQKRYHNHTEKEQRTIVNKLAHYLGQEPEKITSILKKMDPLVSIEKEKIIIPKTSLKRMKDQLLELG